jgi:hypothetical protein
MNGRIRKSKENFERWKEWQEQRKERRKRQKILQLKRHSEVMQRTDADSLNAIVSGRLDLISRKLGEQSATGAEFDMIEVNLLHDELQVFAIAYRTLIELRISALEKMALL